MIPSEPEYQTDPESVILLGSKLTDIFCVIGGIGIRVAISQRVAAAALNDVNMIAVNNVVPVTRRLK
ncbi:hypothetical protein P4S72_02085 [Vibrio sp. PP-XX7]